MLWYSKVRLKFGLEVFQRMYISKIFSAPKHCGHQFFRKKTQKTSKEVPFHAELSSKIGHGFKDTDVWIHIRFEKTNCRVPTFRNIKSPMLRTCTNLLNAAVCHTVDILILVDLHGKVVEVNLQRAPSVTFTINSCESSLKLVFGIYR